MEKRKDICVIGAGSSGLAAIKACKEEDLDVVCYEKSNDYGGLWCFHDDDDQGRASVMKSTIINTSKEMSAFSDFPPPKHLANFMHNTSMMEYFTKYAEYFDLLRHIRYGHEVVSVQKADDYDQTGRWKVTVKDLEKGTMHTKEYDGVMVCAGHHIYPYTPKFEGLERFEGTVLHSHSLKSARGFEDKKVLVMGIGNSAVDAAVEISQVSKKLYISTRRGSWLFSRIGPFGYPYDIVLQRRIIMLAKEYNFLIFADRFVEFVLNFKFNHAKYGLEPDHRVLSAHFTINDALPNNILSGRVVMKQNVKMFTKNGVIFEDEDEEHEIDAVVFATGYEIKYPFISEDILKVKDNSVSLYKLMFPPQLAHPSLAFIALVQPLGAMFPIAEAQSRWFAQLMQEAVQLPSEEEMEHEIKDRREKNSKDFVYSLRHTIQVHFIPYMDEICSEFGAKPDLWKMALTDPRLFLALTIGPSVPYQYRLQGPHSWKEAREVILSAWDRIEFPLKNRKRD